MTMPAAERLPTEIGGPKLRNAALHGDATAAYEIGLRFAEGKGVPANAEEAARWYERAASKGIALAQFRYASMLEKGHGVKKDLTQARRLYLAAATQGNAKAMHNLAVLYAEGIEGRPDYASAVQWFRKAAAYGVSDSEYNLGVLTARGLGIAKDLNDSYKWFALAAAQGDKEAARKRDEVASQMDATSVAAAQRAVKGFVVKPQPHDAVAVAAPAGGWDDAAAPAAHGKAKSGPLALGNYKVGRR
jgi:localization factor PodJL